MIGFASALALLVTVVWLGSPLGVESTLPEPVEEVFPLPGDTVVRQTAIEIDLPVGYSLTLEVDGIRIPHAEIGFTTGTGRFIWQPGPDRLFEVWTAGEHTVTIRWDRVSGGRPDPGEFTWVFRVA